jgi:hypothetical protein
VEENTCICNSTCINKTNNYLSPQINEQTKTHYMMKIQVLAWDMLWDNNPPHLRNWISNGNAELEKEIQ